MTQRKHYQEISYKRRKGKIFLIFKVLGLIFLIFLFGVIFLFIYYTRDLPRPEKFTEKQFIQSTKIFDRTGQVLLYEMYGEEKREIISLNLVPEYLKQAIILAEDANFYYHPGIDFKAIFRSVLLNLKLGKPIYGGSTIPQQLIRSSFLTREKTLERKVREIVLTLELSRRYSKDQILEWYLNQVPFGSNCYGIEAASKTYFKKSAKDLSIAEAAVLASLIRAPTYLSPYGENIDELLVRKNRILDKLAEAGYLTKEEVEQAKKEELKFAKILRPIKAPHFVMHVQDYLVKNYGEDFLREKGLRVYTSLDWELQDLAERIVLERAKINEKYKAYNAALVAISPKTGEILAMVGSKDWFGDSYPENCKSGVNCFFEPKVNVATYRIGRQPGSAFKPFVYATAFKKGFDDKTKIIDEETNFGIWGGEEFIPKNYVEKFYGEVTTREALAQSINVASVKVLRDLAGLGDMNIGLEDSAKTAKDLGITTLNPPYGPSMVLGGWEVKLLEITSAYGVFATEGLRNPPVSILKIEDWKGNIIEENKNTPKRVLEKEVCRLLNDILSDNEARTPLYGPRSSLFFENYQVAAKTGTTNNYKDAWVIGYTPSIVTGVWVGNNDSSPMLKKPGVALAGPIFHAFMKKALLKFPKENFNPPTNYE